MPEYTRDEGIVLFKDDACRSCRNYPDNCNVMSDFRLSGREAPYNKYNIVQVGQANGKTKADGVVECQMYSKLIPMSEREDHPEVKSGDFGKTDSFESYVYYQSVGEDRRKK